MEALIGAVTTALSLLEWRSIVDILVVGLIVYWLLTLIQGTTAIMVVRGIVTLLIVGTMLAYALNLTMLNWLLAEQHPGPDRGHPDPVPAGASAGAGADRAGRRPAPALRRR